MTHAKTPSAELVKIRESEARLSAMIAQAALAEDPEAFRVLVEEKRPAIWARIASVLGNTLVTQLVAGHGTIRATWLFGLEQPTLDDSEFKKLRALRAQTWVHPSHVERGKELVEATRRLADTSGDSLVAGRSDTLLGLPAQKVKRGTYAFPRTALYSGVSSEIAGAMTSVEISDDVRPTIRIEKSDYYATRAVYILGALANDAVEQTDFANDLFADSDVITRDSVFAPDSEAVVREAVACRAGLARHRKNVADMGVAAALLEDVSWNVLPSQPVVFALR